MSISDHTADTYEQAVALGSMLTPYDNNEIKGGIPIPAIVVWNWMCCSVEERSGQHHRAIRQHNKKGVPEGDVIFDAFN